MQSPIRLILALVLLSVVTACKQDVKPPVEPQDTTPSPVAPPTQPKDTGPDPRDYTDPRNLDNPASLLSKRVILFDFDKSDIRPEYRDIVKAHATYMAARSSAKVTLEGHADERGSREYNLGLGERRGNSVGSALGAQRAPRDHLEVVSYGEERPVCRNSEENCWEKNRRVEIVYISR